MNNLLYLRDVELPSTLATSAWIMSENSKGNKPALTKEDVLHDTGAFVNSPFSSAFMEIPELIGVILL